MPGINSEELKPGLDRAILKLDAICRDKHAAWLQYKEFGFQFFWEASMRLHKDLEKLRTVRRWCDEMEVVDIDDDIICLLILD